MGAGDRIEKYGIRWPGGYSYARIEMDMIRRGGGWVTENGKTIGCGLFHHYKELESILFGKEKLWHAWNELQLEMYLQHRTVGVIGPASSGKTNSAATDVLADYYVWPECTTVIICSTTKERLEDRIFGEMKKYHRIAKRNFPWLPGNLIEGRLRIVSDSRHDSVDGRDFRNGIIGVPCFFSGTLVDTPSGKVPIESVKIGDRVLNACGVGTVTETHHRHAKHCCRITLSDGRVIDCTFDHPIFTNSGWKNAIDLETFDMVFSAHETMQIVRGKFGGRLSQQKILLNQLPRLLASKTMRTVRNIVSALASPRQAQSKLRKILFNLLRRSVGIATPRVQGKENVVVSSLREVDAFQASQQRLLLSEMPEPARANALRILRKEIHFDSGISIEETQAVLQSILCMERDAETATQEGGSSYAGGIGYLETVPRLSMELPHPKRPETKEWVESMVQAGHSVLGHKTGGGDRWRRAQNSSRIQERCSPDRNPGGAWVVGVEVLEPRGDGRYSESEGGYPVHNLEVSGHPSYTANGIVVHNCKRGGDYVGLGDFIGIKNKRVRMVADELQLLPSAFIMAISNLDKNPDLKVVGLGNPKETTDALGCFCEPEYGLGGWDGGIDQNPKTKTWKTRRPDGICIQLVGSDSPNLDGKLGIPLITQAAIDRDIAQYGKDSLQFTMMNQGMMPRGQGSRRVITRQLCAKNKALDDPQWLTETRTRVGFLDAAYRGTGGDRCVFGELQFGPESETVDAATASFIPNIVNQAIPKSNQRNVVALIDQIIVPINVKIDMEPEEQIVNFVKTLCMQRGIAPENFFFDSGMRTSLVSRFAQLWSPNTVPIDCGGSPSDRPVSAQIAMPCNKYYSKFITELWFSVRLIIEAGQFRGMKDGVMQEGCQREWKIVGANKIEVEPKADMKEKTGKSPDLFDALAIGVEGARRLGFVINNNFAKVKGKDALNDWHKKLKEKAREQWTADRLDHAA